jgi:photosystem II stability/assembly factor-like uncharacterized protein
MFLTYIGTNRGVYRLDDRSLEPLGLNDHEIYAIHWVEGILLAGSYGEGIFRSEDGGRSWQEANEGLMVTALRTFLNDPKHEGAVLCGCEPGRGFRTRDKGNSWEELIGIRTVPGSEDWFLPYSPRAGALRNYWSPPGRPDHLLAAIEVGGLLESHDGGETWGQIDLYGNDIQDDDIHYVSGHPENPDLLLLALGWAVLPGRKVAPDELGGVGLSEDGGKTWRKVLREEYTRAVLIPPTHPNLILAGPAKAVGRQGRILVSEDGGESWKPASEGLQKSAEEPMADMVERFQPAPDGSIWAVCSGGRLFRATPGEWNWLSVVTLPAGVTAESVCFVG